MISDPRRIHLIGISGNGMFPLALLMNEAGLTITGSDSRLPAGRQAALDARGITNWETGAHQNSPRHMPMAGHVVVSPAIPRHHPELRAALQNGSRIESRAEALARLIAGREAVCVAGSHGKSTTTAMLMAILTAHRGDRFGYMIGAEGAAALPARLGADDSIFVMEACEAHGALPAWQPTHAILTNADDEHTDHYSDGGGLQDSFLAFLRRVPAHGAVIVSGDDNGAASLASRLSRPVITCGLGPENRLRADTTGSTARVFLDGKAIGDLSISVPGAHNIRNALAALAMALHLHIPASCALEALSRFHGLTRRLQRLDRGTGPRIFDDFAHHPAEIAASLSALRPSTAGRLIAILEPQLHSRVTRLAGEFASALGTADLRFVLPVTADGEPVTGASGDAALAAACHAAGVKLNHAASSGDLLAMLSGVVEDHDTLIVMSGSHGASHAAVLRDRLNVASRNSAQTSDDGALPKLSFLRGRQANDLPDLLAAILAHVRAMPDAAAVEMGTRRLTYQQLASRAAALAMRLTSDGSTAQHVVGVCLQRSVDRVTAFTATLMAGAVYLPLDPTLPRSRLDQMLADSGARAVIVNAASPALTTGGKAVVNCDFIESAAVPAPVPPKPGTLAYAIYTSGTSGHPKAVLIGRRALSNYAASAMRGFEIDRSSRVSLVSAFGFDVSIGDMAMALGAGACLVLPTDLQAQPGNPLARFISQTRLTHLSLTPSLLSAIPHDDYPDLRAVIVAGEACPQSLADRWASQRSFFNAYGPTETTVEVTFARCRPHHAVTAGTPIDNVGLCILSSDLLALPIGAEGEVCIFGDALAQGYHDRPDLTASRFPLLPGPGPYADDGPLRVYRTGDRGYIDENGQLCLTGRLDEQIKFNGFRIEPGEIEAALCRQPGVLDACVSVIRGRTARNRLVAHVVADPQHGPFDIGAVSMELQSILPSYMQPSLFLPVQAIPRTANGKRDRSALPTPHSLLSPRKVRRTKSATELKLIELLSPFVDGDMSIGRRKSLSRWGVDSLSMANFIMEIERHFAISLDMVLEPGSDTIEALGLMVEAALGQPQQLAVKDAVSQMASRLQPLLVGWPGIAVGFSGLIRQLPDAPGDAALFWICQRGFEFEALARLLADEGVALLGLRSGDRVLDYASDDLPAVTRLYADEIESVAPAGPLYLGGNCQGGMMMRHVAIELQRRGRDIGLLILMEQSRFSPAAAPVLLLFGEQSYLNPYAQMKNPDALFRLAYSAGYNVDMIPGGHGEYFLPDNVGALAQVILRHLRGKADFGGSAATPAPPAGTLPRDPAHPVRR